MPRFDVYACGNGYFLDVQADLLKRLNTRIAVPLQPSDEAPTPGRVLNPIIIIIDDQPFVMVTQFVSAMYRSELGHVISNHAPEAATRTRALDIALHGF